MKLKDILAIQSIVENRATPYDLLESGYTYYSKSKDEYIDLLDLHITHFIRIFLKQVEENNDKMTYDRSYNSRLDKMRMTTQDLLNDIQYLRHDSDEQKYKRIFNSICVSIYTYNLYNINNTILEV